jgi:hypothetical protein
MARVLARANSLQKRSVKRQVQATALRPVIKGNRVYVLCTTIHTVASACINENGGILRRKLMYIMSLRRVGDTLWHLLFSDESRWQTFRKTRIKSYIRRRFR